MWKILRPPKHKPPVAAEKIDKEYKRLRLQVFIGIFIGYAGYYLVRKNFTLAMPHLVEMGFDKGCGSGRGRSVRSGSPPWWPSWSRCLHSC